MRIYPEPLLFCLAWAALAVFGFARAGQLAGALLTVGLLLVIMPASALVVSKTEDFGLERQIRWGILAIAALALAIWLQVQSSSSS